MRSFLSLSLPPGGEDTPIEVIYLHQNASCRLEALQLVPLFLPLGISLPLDSLGLGLVAWVWVWKPQMETERHRDQSNRWAYLGAHWNGHADHSQTTPFFSNPIFAFP